MNNSQYFQKVSEFQDTFSIEQSIQSLIKSRLSLINEEFKEFIEAISIQDRIEALDGLMDLRYVLLGSIYEVQKLFKNLSNTYRMISSNSFNLSENIVLINGAGYIALNSDLEQETSKELENFLIQLYRLDNCVKNEANSYFDEIVCDMAFSLIHSNNMSKFHKTIKEAQITIAKKGIENDFYTINKNGGVVLYQQSTNKVIKPYNFKKVELKSIFE
jgi:hypothetical protein